MFKRILSCERVFTATSRSIRNGVLYDLKCFGYASSTITPSSDVTRDGTTKSNYNNNNDKADWTDTHKLAPQGGAEIPDNLSIRQRRIIYRCKQRGWLELDILLGSWAVKYVPSMVKEQQYVEIERLLDADTPDVLKWVLKHQPPPTMFDTQTLRSIQSFAAGDRHVTLR